MLFRSQPSNKLQHAQVWFNTSGSLSQRTTRSFSHFSVVFRVKQQRRIYAITLFRYFVIPVNKYTPPAEYIRPPVCHQNILESGRGVVGASSRGVGVSKTTSADPGARCSGTRLSRPTGDPLCPVKIANSMRRVPSCASSRRAGGGLCSEPSEGPPKPQCPGRLAQRGSMRSPVGKSRLFRIFRSFFGSNSSVAYNLISLFRYIVISL